MKKILAACVVCYVAYKLGQQYLKENNLTAEDVFDSAKKKAEAFAKQTAGVVPTTKDGEPEGKKIYTFGKEKRIEMVHLADGVTGLYDNKKNYPIEKQVKIYSEDGGKLYVYSDAADYVISDEPFFMNVYVKDKDKTEAIAIAPGKQYDAEEIAVYNYGSSQKFDAQGMAAEAEADIEQDVQIGDTHAKRGTILASENEACTALVLVARGTVMASTRSDDHSYQIDETLQAPLLIQPEHIFGIKQRYTSTFCAQTYCEVIRIEKPTLADRKSVV